MKIYISGPITGHNDWQEQHHAVIKQVTRAGDIPLHALYVAQGYDPTMHEDGRELSEEDTWSYWMEFNIGLLTAADMVLLMPGWENSRGCRIEVAYAMTQNIPVIPLEAYLIKGRVEEGVYSHKSI